MQRKRATFVATRWRCWAAWFIRPCPIILQVTELPETRRLELFPQSQDLRANLLIRWVRLCSLSFLASAFHFPFPYGQLSGGVRVYLDQFSHWCSMFPQLPLVSGAGKVHMF